MEQKKIVLAILGSLLLNITLMAQVGIGTINPDYPLHILCGEYNGTTQGINSTYPNNGILVQKNSGSSGATLYLEYLLTSGRRWAVTSGGSGNLGGVGNFIISDMNAGTDRLVIKGGTGEVGIGTANPTAQLHTTSSVRFQGIAYSDTLTNIVVRDNNGNLYYRNFSSLFPIYSGWQLTGNATTSPEFLGTTNNNDLRFRTNNTQRMVITSAGKLGLGTSTPYNAADIFFSDDPLIGNNGLLLSNSGNHAAILYLENTNSGGRRWGLGSTGTSNEGGPGNLAIADFTGAFNAVVMEGGTGNFGINVNNPEANFHVDGTVRFENLPSGNGNALVIGTNGEVKVAQSQIYRTLENDKEFELLKLEVEMLKKQVAALLAEEKTKQVLK